MGKLYRRPIFVSTMMTCLSYFPNASCNLAGQCHEWALRLHFGKLSVAQSHSTPLVSHETIGSWFTMSEANEVSGVEWYPGPSFALRATDGQAGIEMACCEPLRQARDRLSRMVPRTGVEPVTYSLEGCRSIQLSYRGLLPIIS